MNFKTPLYLILYFQCVISSFRHEGDKNCALLGYYAASSVVISYRRFGTPCRSYLDLENGTNRLSRNFSKKLLLAA
jgi:hypothetical protein